MFDSLQERLGDVLDKLTRRGALSEADVTAAMREVRVALLEADVALPVVKDFVEAVKSKDPRTLPHRAPCPVANRDLQMRERQAAGMLRQLRNLGERYVGAVGVERIGGGRYAV